MARNKGRTFKRIFVASDPHCGHETGLTHPEFDPGGSDHSAKVRAECWEWFKGAVKAKAPYDIALWGGDILDGTGDRSGGTEQITMDMFKQAQCFFNITQTVKAKENVLVYGTTYHTACKGHDFEHAIANIDHLEDHAFIKVNGVIFDLKHKISGSTVPWGRHTASSKAHYLNELNSIKKREPRADIILRAHVHYHQFCGGDGWIAMTIPALAWGSKFGKRQCEGIVDFGFLIFDIYNDGRIAWESHIVLLESQKARVIEL